MPKISIVMPVYNSEKYLKNCLESLFNQTFKDFELICINDGSTDNSLNILNDFKNKYSDLISITSRKNSGCGSARNFGFEFVKSETVLFLDSDDYFYPNFLEKMYSKYLETNADIIICRYDVCLPDGEISQKSVGISDNMLPSKQVFNKNDFPKYIFNFVNHAAWNKLIKTKLIKENNLKFENIPDSNDVFFTLGSLFFAESISIVNEPLLIYNFLNVNSTTIKRNINLNIYIFETFKNLEKLIGNNSLFTISLYNAYLSSVMYTLNFLRGDIRKEFLKLIKLNLQLHDKKDVYRPYLYQRLFFIKKLPVNIFILLYKIKCTIKRSIPNYILRKIELFIAGK